MTIFQIHDIQILRIASSLFIRETRKIGPFCIQPHPQSFIDNSWVVANNFCEWMFFGVFHAKTCKVFLKQLKIYFKHVEEVSIKFVIRYSHWVNLRFNVTPTKFLVGSMTNFELIFVSAGLCSVRLILRHPHLFEDSLLVEEYKNPKRKRKKKVWTIEISHRIFIVCTKDWISQKNFKLHLNSNPKKKEKQKKR